MAVALTASSIFTPTTPYNDALSGGGFGIDFGVGTNNQWTPIIDKSSNTGFLSIYLSHDGVNEITELKYHIQQYGLGTGYTYSGDATAADDYAAMLALGDASGSSPNNADGLSGGIWMETDSDVSGANLFNRAARPTEILVARTGFGDTLANAFDLPAASMIYDSGGGTEAQPSGPVDGTVGPSGNTVFGDRCKLLSRVYFPNAFSTGGTMQYEIVFTFAFST
jgi:hypothetical protein